MTRIITDSTAEYEHKEANDKNITIVPLNVIFGEESFRDNFDITKDEFYKRLEKSDPKTSQPSPDSFVKVFEEIKEAKDDAVVMTIGLGISGTYQSALLAKDIVEYDNIYIIDTKTTSAALKIIVDYATKLASDGLSGKEIYDEIMNLLPRVELRISPATLEYLYRGGRLTKGQMTAANLLRIKPVLVLSHENGKVEVPYKGIGIKGAIDKIVKEMVENGVDRKFKVVFAKTTDDINVNKIIKAVCQKFDGIEYEVVRMGAIIGTHLGPEGYMVAYVKKA